MGKILTNCWKFAKFVNIFPRQNFALYGSLFHKVVNTTCSPIGVDGGEWWGAMKWRELSIQNFIMTKWLQFRLFSAPHVMITQCSYIDAQSHLWGAVCVKNQFFDIYERRWPGKFEPFTDRLSIRGRQTGP